MAEPGPHINTRAIGYEGVVSLMRALPSFSKLP